MLVVQRHPFHLIDPSPWPLVGSIGAFMTATGLVLYMHNYSGGGLILTFGFFFLVSLMAIWWRDVIREAAFQGFHTQTVQAGLRIGMLLFIVSEVMFFFAFFFAFFWSSLGPNVEIGGVWPPAGIEVLNPWEIPLANTLILLTSGAACTWAHHALLAGQKQVVFFSLTFSIFLGLLFTELQAFEYLVCSFSINDGVYGSTFFLATGFHGFHVIVGTTFLLVCLGRHVKDHFTSSHHAGFEFACWYWHFVDVVWLFLFVSIYYWGGL